MEGDTVTRIMLCSFFLEFSPVCMWVQDASELLMAARLAPASFAAWCWGKQIVPITCRFGQNLDTGTLPGQKALFSQLCGAAAAGDEAMFVARVVAFHKARVLTRPHAVVVAAILALQPVEINRMVALSGFLRGRASFGDLSVKNLVEALLAHGIWGDPSPAELDALPYGSGASDFLKWAEVDKAELLEFMKVKWTQLQHCGSIRVYNGTKFVRAVEFSELGVPVLAVTNVLLQYWACAQGRILGVAEAFFRKVQHAVPPPHMRTNKQVKQLVADAFEGAAVPGGS